MTDSEKHGSAKNRRANTGENVCHAASENHPQEKRGRERKKTDTALHNKMEIL